MLASRALSRPVFHSALLLILSLFPAALCPLDILLTSFAGSVNLRVGLASAEQPTEVKKGEKRIVPFLCSDMHIVKMVDNAMACNSRETSASFFSPCSSFPLCEFSNHLPSLAAKHTNSSRSLCFLQVLHCIAYLLHANTAAAPGHDEVRRGGESCGRRPSR